MQPHYNYIQKPQKYRLYMQPPSWRDRGRLALPAVRAVRQMLPAICGAVLVLLAVWPGDAGTPQTESKPSSSPNVAKFYQLDSGICLNGDKAALFAYHEPADQGLSHDWVIQIGGPPELNWCIDPAHCAMFAKPAAPGTTCSTNASLCPDNTTLTFGHVWVA